MATGIPNDDNNKVFSIGFKTPPYDDTGMQHIAAATGTKTLSIHGPTNPLTRGAYSKDAEFIESKCDCKYCYGTKKNLYCDNRKCLNMIKVDDVVEQVIKIISR